MDLPQYREAAQRLEAVQEQVTAAEHDIAELEKQKKACRGLCGGSRRRRRCGLTLRLSSPKER